MINSINNNPYIANYTATARNEKSADVFALPNQEDISATDSELPVKDRITMIDYEEVQEFLHTKAKVLPDDIGMRGEKADEYFKNQGAPILYVFNEDGSASIKEGLSLEHYRLALKNLANVQPFRSGLGYGRR